MALDMRLFQLPTKLTADVDQVRDSLERLRGLARSYWSGDRSSRPFVELLCEGLDVDGWAGHRA